MAWPGKGSRAEDRPGRAQHETAAAPPESGGPRLPMRWRMPAGTGSGSALGLREPGRLSGLLGVEPDLGDRQFVAPGAGNVILLRTFVALEDVTLGRVGANVGTLTEALLRGLRGGGGGLGSGGDGLVEFRGGGEGVVVVDVGARRFVSGPTVVLGRQEMPHGRDGARDEGTDEHELRELLELAALALLFLHGRGFVTGGLVQGLLQVGQQLGCDLLMGRVNGGGNPIEHAP